MRNQTASNTFVRTDKITVGFSKGKGRGVFATRRIYADEVIEKAPVLLVPRADVETLAGTFLANYMFHSDNNRHVVIGLGLTSMLNHDDNANAEFFITGETITIKAKRSIPTGAEVTINYGWGSKEWDVSESSTPPNS